MREEIGRRRLPFRVVVADDLAALAATGHRTVWIASGRRVSRADVERTVLHEIEGHVLPRVRASALDLGISVNGQVRQSSKRASRIHATPSSACCFDSATPVQR